MIYVLQQLKGLEMIEITRSCEGCIFIIKDDDKPQEGCSLGRTIKLNPINKFDDKNQYQILSRFCNTYRPQEWKKMDMVSPAASALEEVLPVAGVIVNFEHNLGALEQTLESMFNQKGNKFKYLIVINDRVEYNEEIGIICKKYIDKWMLVQMLEEYQHKDCIDNVFNHVKNGYIILVKAGYKFPTEFLQTIHERINIDMEPLMVAYDRNKEKILTSASLYKFLKGNKPKINEDGTTDKRNFFERLADVPTEGNSIVDWENLFNE